MHRVASSTRGSTNASVGQASRQRVQLPQRSRSKGGVAVQREIGEDRADEEEGARRPGRISMVFLPIQPSPARWASSRSGTGPASAKVRGQPGALARRKSASSRQAPLGHRW